MLLFRLLKMLKESNIFHIVRVVAPHILILVAVSAYILIGGVIFMYLEATTPWSVGQKVNETYLISTTQSVPIKSNADKDDKDFSNPCSDESLEILLKTIFHGCCAAIDQNQEECYNVIKDELLQCVKLVRESTSRSAKKDWDYYAAVILSFTIVTTIGYGHIAPSNSASRLFCVFYGLLGIPLTLLAIADHGRFLSSALQYVFNKLKKLIYKIRGKSEALDVAPNDDDRLSPMLLLILYCGYLVFGSLLLIKWEKEWTFSDAFYFSFISLSTIGFGDVVPSNHAYLGWVLLYIGTGLALSSTAVDILAEYLKTLHQFGKKIRNVTHAKIWFGGKMLTVMDLVSTVGKYFGATEEALTHLVQNMDTVVSHVITEKETGVKQEPLLSPYNLNVTPRQHDEAPVVNAPSPVPPAEEPRNYQKEAGFIDD